MDVRLVRDRLATIERYVDEAAWAGGAHPRA